MNFVQFFINTLLHFDFLKISLYDGVFSHSQLIILLKKYDGLGLFCSGYVCRAQNVYGPQNVGFCENWFLMLAIKQYMAKWYLTSSFDIHYEIQTGGANLYQYFWFVPHHCRSNVADEFCSIFHQYPIAL